MKYFRPILVITGIVMLVPAIAYVGSKSKRNPFLIEDFGRGSVI